MATRGYFAHVSPGGATLVDRLQRTRYVSPRCRWDVGEALAWGTGSLATPAARVQAWMDSAEHRAVLLDPDYRDAGIAAVATAPDGEDGLTLVADLGRRRC